MIAKISNKNLQNPDPIFQHNFNLDHLTKGFMSWIGISKEKKFRIYSINGCSQIYDWTELNAVKLDLLCKFFLKPKVPRRDDFETIVRKPGELNIPYNAITYFSDISDVLTEKGLLPIKRKLNYLGCNIRSYVAQKFLCGRNGMSYGFIAYQISPKLGEISKINLSNFEKYKFQDSQFYFHYNAKYYKLSFPTIQIITTRSGCDKSNINPETDLLLYKIKNFQIKQIVSSKQKFQPSFDIWIILIQAICNSIICSILSYINPEHSYVKKVKEHGIMLVHIHAFPNKESLPKGYLVFGNKNPSISCGCSESSYFCLHDQLDKFFKNIEFNQDNYAGSLFLEKDHGIVLGTAFSSYKSELKKLFENYEYGEKNFKTFRNLFKKNNINT